MTYFVTEGLLSDLDIITYEEVINEINNELTPSFYFILDKTFLGFAMEDNQLFPHGWFSVTNIVEVVMI